MRVSALLAFCVLAIVALSAPAARAQSSAEAEIRAAFAQWTQDFNAQRADKTCDLFARDLVANYRGVPERGYDRQCKILHDSLSDPERSYRYALTIKEILVFGDIAVARIAWTLVIRDTTTGKETTVIEPGLDLFRRESDGQWRIFRYVAYDEG
jgi:steroid delta-isomerase